MASAMRKMAVYLGLVEDDRYDDDYDEYDIYDDEAADRRRVERADDESSSAGAPDQPEDEQKTFGAERRPSLAESAVSDLARITTLHPRTYNEARTIGEHFREGTPVIMNLTEMVDSDAKRLVDFAAGLIFGLHGSIERVTNKVFLLSPVNVEVTAEDKARMAERGFFNQS
jgi:cell division inhibitor SepF